MRIRVPVTEAQTKYISELSARINEAHGKNSQIQCGNEYLELIICSGIRYRVSFMETTVWKLMFFLVYHLFL